MKLLIPDNKIHSTVVLHEDFRLVSEAGRGQRHRPAIGVLPGHLQVDDGPDP